jgi:ABC-2 type transport system permease protein
MRTVGLLFWLKFRLMLRGYRKVSAVVGALLLLLVFLPISIGIAVACGAGFFAMSAPMAAHVLAGVLCGIYLFWLLAPILGFAINDTYDITRLFVYPLTQRQIFIGSVVGSLLDVPTLLLLPTLAVATAGFGNNPIAFLVALAAMLLFLFHTLSLSQAILLASAGALKSRRYRDLSTLIFFAIMACYYLGTQYLARAARFTDWASLARSPLWGWLRLLPPGAAAEAAAQARMGEYGLAAGWLLLLALYTAGAVWLASWILERVYAGDVDKAPTAASTQAPQGGKTHASVEAARAPEGGRRSPLLAFWQDRVPPVMQAMAEKEARYMVRDPYFRTVMSSLAYVVVVFGFSLYSTSHRAVVNPAVNGATITNGMLWFMTGMLLLTESATVCNQYGAEGRSAAFLFALPGSRLQILLAKNLVLFAALSAVNVVSVAALCALAGAMERIGLMLIWVELSLLSFLAAGNLLSILFPYRIVVQGWRIRYGSGSAGFGYFLLYLGIMLILALVMAPVLLALMLPLYFDAPQWWAASIPLSVLYAVGLYALSVKLAVPLLLSREPEIISKMTDPAQ